MKHGFTVDLTFEVLDKILRYHFNEIPSGVLVHVEPHHERDYITVKYISDENGPKVWEMGEYPNKSGIGLVTTTDLAQYIKVLDPEKGE